MVQVTPKMRPLLNYHLLVKFNKSTTPKNRHEREGRATKNTKF